MYQLAALFICAGLSILLQWIRRRRRHLMEITKNIKLYPGEQLPFFGHVFGIVEMTKKLRNPALMKPETNPDLRGNFKLWYGPTKLAIVLQEPKHVEELANTILTKADTFKLTIAAWIGQGLLTSDAEQWIKTRKMLNPTFSQYNLNKYMEVFNKQSLILSETIGEHVGKGEFDPSPSLLRSSLETICQTAIALPDVGKDRVLQESYIHAAHRYSKEIVVTKFKTIWMHVSWLYALSSTYREERKIVKTLKDFSANALKRKRLELASSQGVRNTGGKRFKTFMDLLIELGADGSFTDKKIGDEVDTMILAGHETTSTLLMFTLVMMRIYPDVQEQAYKEIQEIFGEEEREVTKYDLPKLTYLEAVLMETLRKYPLAPFLGRRATVDTKLGEIAVPAGSDVVVNVCSLHWNEAWGDPSVFRPERWLDPASVAQLRRLFGGFGYGRRACIGKMYALMSMKTSLVYILRRYEICGSNDIPLKTQWDSVVRPVAGHFIEVKKR